MVKAVVCAVVGGSACSVGAQTTLYALRAGGQLLRLDPATGASTVIGASGVAVQTAAPGSGWHSETVSATGPGVPGVFYRINRWTGEVWTTAAGPPPPAGYTIRAISGGYLVFGADDPVGFDVLARFSGSGFEIVGSTGHRRIFAAAMDSQFSLLALSEDQPGGALYRINPFTAETTLVAAGGFGDATHALAFTPTGLFACGSVLLGVDPASGATTPIGPTGYGDIRALVPITRAFYPDCVQSTTPPVLNVLDFVCFVNRFAAGDPYANCDQSTTPPVLDILDFNCFINAFFTCCSAP